MNTKRMRASNKRRDDSYRLEMLQDLKEFYLSNTYIDYAELSRLSESICGMHFSAKEINLASDADPEGTWSTIRETSRQELRCPHCDEILGPEFMYAEDEDDNVKFRTQMKDIATAIYEHMMLTKEITSANVNAWLNLMERLGINTLDAGGGATSSIDVVIDEARKALREKELDDGKKNKTVALSD